MLPKVWSNRGLLLSPSLDDFVDGFFTRWPSFERDTEYTWSPRVDVHETDKDILIDVEAPGLEKKDIKVEVKNNNLTISGESKSERKTEEAQSCRVERRYGKFERTFGLPDTIQTDKVTAAYKNGILNLTLPKTEKAIPKEVRIEVK